MDTIQVHLVDTVQMVNSYMQSGGSDLIMITATVVIAFAAVFIPLFQIFTTRNHNKLTVLPHIDIYVSDLPSITVENNGVGPAKIKSFKISLDDTEIPRSTESYDLDPLGKKFGFTEFPFQYKYYSEGNFVKPGESIVVLKVKPTVSQFKDQNIKIREIMSKAHVTITYESIYGEQFSPATLN